MPRYEYRVITAPARGIKAKGIGSAEARFAHALEEAMNTMAKDGWEYQRAETLPSVERTSVSTKTTIWRNVLVFRRSLPQARTPRPAVLQLTDPVPKEASVAHTSHMPRPLPEIVAPQHPEDDASRSQGASRMLVDNGVEGVSDVAGLSTSLKQLAANRKKARSNG